LSVIVFFNFLRLTYFKSFCLSTKTSSDCEFVAKRFFVVPSFFKN
jgi:hypothetical protein